jgi:hypothetical protein
VESSEPSYSGRLIGRKHAALLVRELMEPRGAGNSRGRRQAPVLVFEGGHGSGKSALLDGLGELLDTRVPYARVDFEADEARTVSQVLSALAFMLARRCGGYGTLRFPRLVIGQLVISQELDASDREKARAQVLAALRAHRRIDRHVEVLQQAAGELVPAAQASVGWLGWLPLASLARHGFSLLDSGLVRLAPWVMLGRFQDWYGHQDLRRQDDSIDVLVDLNLYARQPDAEADRLRAEELLWSAFLADLRHNFRGRRARRRPLNCVVLLDNIDAAHGRGFLAGLDRARRRRAALGATEGDPVTVVATRRTRSHLSERPSDEAVVAPGDTYADYLTDAGSPAPMCIRQRLPDLSEDEVDAMVASSTLHRGNDRHVAMLLYRFTGGHPASTRLMLDAATDRPMRRVDLDHLLDRPAAHDARPAAPTLQHRLLRHLLPGLPERAVDDLAACAAARDADLAERMARDSGLLNGRPQDRNLRAADIWTSTSTGGSTVLRRLLLRRLAGLGDQRWSQVHAWLRDRCKEDGDRDGELYYELAATGDVKGVAEDLARRVGGHDVSEWLGTLLAVTAAPHNSGSGDVPIDRVRALTEWADPQDRLLSAMARLVAGLWVAAEPRRAAGRRDLHLEIIDDFAEVARHVPRGRGADRPRREADRHREIAEQWGRDDDLPD